ncbi:hypothetical protein [Pseudoxanthomonas sp.]|uniref:hypothetical protein n=1 Tax=Pseudoxanthomonas sp. TaxID=1871049 RepID=UPI003F804BA5
MTAEVAVLNCSGVALAADSAVTVGSQKIYNSAVKLFALSKVAPVAIMVYGNAALSNVPWEIVINEYRRTLGATKLKKLDDYVSGFIEFIRESKILFSADGDNLWLFERCDFVVQAAQKSCMGMLHSELAEADGRGLGEKDVKDCFKLVLKKCLDNLSTWPDLEPSKEVLDRVTPAINKIVEHVGKDYFGDLYLTVARTLKRLAIEAFKRAHFPGPSSGIVIAGYGDDELYPNIRTLEFDGAVSGFARLKKDLGRSETISPGDNSAAIIAYAQEDMVMTFMEGMNPAVRTFIDSSLTSLFGALPDALMQGMGISEPSIRNSLVQICDNIKQGFQESAERHRDQEHVSPVLHMVTALPKDELAAMAESLVNLTAFKRRVTGALETVGGPIDVCVISKSDGLVWVKRKHYFPPELNQMYHQNYMRDIGSE